MELSNDWHKRTNVRLADILSDILKETRPPKVPKPTHGYRIAEKAPEIVTAPGAYFPEKKGRVIPLESRQAGGPVTPTRTLQQMLEKLASYAPFPIPGAAGQSRAARERVEGQGENRFETAIEPKQLPLVPRQMGGEVDPNLFKEKFSVNSGDTRQGIEASANTALLKDTPLNVSPLTPSLQSFAPGANLTPTGPSTPLTGMAEYEANARKTRGLPPETGTPTVNPTDNRLNLLTGALRSFMKPSPFKENRRSPIFGSDQRAAYDKKLKPYTDFMEGTKETPLFSRAGGGAISPDPLEGLSEEERKRRVALLKKEFPAEPLASSRVATTEAGGPLVSYATTKPAEEKTIDMVANASGTFEQKGAPVMTKLLNAGETTIPTIPKKEFTEYPKVETPGSLSEIKKDILASGETRYTIGDEQGGITVPKGFTPGEGNLQSFADPELEERKKWATPGYREKRLAEAKKVSPLTVNPETNRVSGTIGVSPGFERTYYEAHPEERAMDLIAEANRPVTDVYKKLVEEARTRQQGYGLGFGPTHRERRFGAREPTPGAEIPALMQGLERATAVGEIPIKSVLPAGIGTAKEPTPYTNEDKYSMSFYGKPYRNLDETKRKVVDTKVKELKPPEDTSEWRTHEAMAREKGWTRDQILADWDRKQIERAGKKAEITMNLATGGASSFPNWDEATKKQSFENFIINNQKPTFAWRDAKSRNTWEQEFNKYLIEKGKTAEGVGETRFYRGAQKKALDNNEVYRVAAERFVNVIDQNVELVKTLKKNYGMNYGKLLNTAANNIIQGVPGSGDLMSLQQVLISLSNEVAKVESGSMGIAEVSVEQAKVWKKIHDYNLNESDLDKVLDTSKQLGEIRRRSLRETTDALRKELGEKEAKPGEVPKPPGTTNRPRVADFGGNPAGGVAAISKEEWVSRARKDERNNQYSDAELVAEYDKKYGGK